MKLQTSTVLFFPSLVLVSAYLAKEKNVVEDKKHDKRGLLGLGYGGYGGFLWTHGLGRKLGGGLGGGFENHGEIKHITLHKTVKVPVPYPIPVPIEKKVPVPILVKVLVHVDKPYPGPVIKPYPVPVEKLIPYPVEKKIPIKVLVTQVLLFQHLNPYPVHKPVPHPVKVPVIIKKTVPILIHNDHDSGFEALSELGGGLRVGHGFEGLDGRHGEFGGSFDFLH